MTSPRSLSNIKKESGAVSPLLLAAALVFIMSGSPASAQNGQEKAYKPVQSNDVINRTHGGYSRSQLLYAQIKQAFVDEELDKAVDLARQAVDEEPSNLDAKTIYAEALYKKYKDDPKDVESRNKCVRMNLVIFRLLKNFGWTLSDKSQHTPFAYRFHEKERKDMLCNARLKELCGRLPKWREDDAKYLKKMLMSEKAVAGKIMKNN